MKRQCSESTFTKDETNHARGRFPAINVGISLGPGGKEPLRVRVGQHEGMMQALLDDENIQRLAQHQDGE